MPDDSVKPMDYKQAGVDIEAGERAVREIKNKVRSTFNGNVLSELGSFGGLYRIDDAWQKPILVSSTDGVGTKLLIAIQAEVLNTVGQDLVNHCVNDILVQGAKPLFFLDYIGVGKLDVTNIAQIIDGFVDACKENSCALIGGEMAEMPGLYKAKDFDLAGTIVGMVEADNLLPRQNIKAGDVLIGLPSSGLHTNGYSLARKVLFERMNLKIDSYIEELSSTLAECLLKIHLSYLSTVSSYLTDAGFKAMAHITGGGISGNLKRILPPGISAEIDFSKHIIPPIFHIIRKGGKISEQVMRQTFNLGIGMICVMSQDLATKFMIEQRALYLGELVGGLALPEVRFK
ncbi:MAG: phosphoribosylformylglycinamidine cyclo-ligase [Candidatus Cloacimonetes bacterium]|jgi:phosphoribosylformylglycinamidine cyclo-ligase|nr:phosphoribosylformylglycinamidine cyclo-ligase [Candidatus Cloacimonadota bacterium]MCB5279700.1 phosphoribosylformylglycinamidine cyclo-ligase [Candidatus Cloacimonadota bacterium]MDD3283347.1 phosphoribosylformylglycinamidine cyclo-ligase [Candidatus Cloacimonadota bacterium]MDY0299290.1 phosphoribosylformylglycinamidine cyclo-ligase [Candidatus Cloacimonadaceae bacterium]